MPFFTAQGLLVPPLWAWVLEARNRVRLGRRLRGDPGCVTHEVDGSSRSERKS